MAKVSCRALPAGMGMQGSKRLTSRSSSKGFLTFCRAPQSPKRATVSAPKKKRLGISWIFQRCREAAILDKMMGAVKAML